MTIQSSVLDALRTLDGICDDCLSEVTQIRPRQSINMNCRELHSRKRITRPTEACARCRRVKIVNRLSEAREPQAKSTLTASSAMTQSPSLPPVLETSTLPLQTEGEHFIAGRCYLVSCVSQKRAMASKAKDLYASDWFTKARRYVERSASPWFILSAEHGLTDPEAVIAPYEKTLNTMGVRERKVWAEKVIGQLKQALPQADTIVVFAGKRYREFLMDDLRRMAREVVVPLQGLRIGEQLSWFGSHGPERENY